jgi:hypothetical protein
MTYVKIGETMYPAAISGSDRDTKWNDRKSKAITLEMTYEQAMKTFVDEMDWFIVYTQDSYVTVNEAGEQVTVTPEPEVYDNSEYCLAGPVTDNRDGTVTVKMGQPTDGELLAIMMGG